MTDFTTINTEVQKLIDAAIAADAVIDAAQLKAALDADAAADAVVLKAKDDALIALQAAFDAYKAAHPDTTPVPVPDPTPTPVPTTGFHDATNTGAKGTLTPWSGSATISTAGTVIQNRSFSGGLTINAANVTVKNCSFKGEVSAGNSAAINFLMEDCTIVGTGQLSGFYGDGTVRRCNISGFQNGMRIEGGPFNIDGNFIHTPKTTTADPHYDGMEVYGPAIDGIIQNNTIAYLDTSCIFIANLWGEVRNVVVNHNKLTGADMPCRTEGWKSNKPITGVRWTNNEVQKGHWGYWDLDRTSPSTNLQASMWDVTKSGNVDLATRQGI